MFAESDFGLAPAMRAVDYDCMNFGLWDRVIGKIKVGWVQNVLFRKDVVVCQK